MEGEKQKILVALSRKLEVAHQAYLKSLRGAQFEVVICEGVDELIDLAKQGPALFVIGTKTKFPDVTGHDLIGRLGELDPPPTAPALVLQDPGVSVSKLPETPITVLQRWSQARESLGLTQPRTVPKAPPKIVHKQVKIESTDQTLDMAFGAPKPSGSSLGGVGDGDLFDPGDISDFSPLTISKPSKGASEATTDGGGVIELTEDDRIPSEESAAIKLAAAQEAPQDEEGGKTEDLPFGIPQKHIGKQSTDSTPSAEDKPEAAEKDHPSYTPPKPESVPAPEASEPRDGEESALIHDDATEDLEAPPVHIPEPRLPDKTEEVEPSFLFDGASSEESSPGLAQPVSSPGLAQPVSSPGLAQPVSASAVAPAPTPAIERSSKRTTLKFAIIGIVGLIMTVTGFGIIYFTSDDGDGSQPGGGMVVTPPDVTDAMPVLDGGGDAGAVVDSDVSPTKAPSDGNIATPEERTDEIVLPIKFRRHSYDPYSVKRREIREIVDMIKNNPDVTYELIGFASTDESKTRADILGIRRAKRARDVICLHGPSRTRFKTRSGGASRPIVDDSGQEFFEKSRRVIIRPYVEEE